LIQQHCPRNERAPRRHNQSFKETAVKNLVKGLLALLMLPMAGFAQAQAPTAKVITILVPTTSGTASDIASRLLAPRLSQRLGQPVIVDNRTGASGTIAIGAAAKAAPDGNTILIVPNTMAMISSLYKSLPWDPVEDFAPVARLGKMLVATVVNPSVPAANLSQLVALAKSKPGQLNYASPGAGTPHHLRTEMFKQLTGADIVHIPYKGSAGAVSDLGAGHVQVGFFPLHAVLPLVKGDKLRMLATSGDTRSQWTPDVPTYRESGINGLNDYDWIGAFLPRKTPPDIVNRLSRELIAIFSAPDFQEELAQRGIIANPGGPGDMSALLKRELVEWRQVVTDARITAE
jgi:tripartite-type tricarboxylate transporter receptor subunit TctC